MGTEFGQVMNMRYVLFEETAMISTIISLLLGIMTFWDKKERLKKIIAGVMLVLTIVIMLNYVNLKYWNSHERCEVPFVEGMKFSHAQTVLRSHGLTENLIGREIEEVSQQEAIVSSQYPVNGTKVEKGSRVDLVFKVESGNDIIVIPERSNKQEKLSLTIDSWEAFEEGYHYEFPDPENPDRTVVIDFEAGLSGTYKYSRELSDEERENWFHGGKLYDANGNEIGEEGNYPTFWSSPEGLFAIEFPKGLQSGVYTYELYQNIGGQGVSDTIEFEVK